jgi:transcriptional regulator with XRE-family HTH domain
MPLTQKQIGAWLAGRREAAGMTQMDAAAKLGKQSSLLSKWERGQLRMSAESFLELVQLYDVARDLVKWLDSLRPGGQLRYVAEPAPLIPVSEPLAKKGAKRAAK